MVRKFSLTTLLFYLTVYAILLACCRFPVKEEFFIPPLFIDHLSLSFVRHRSLPRLQRVPPFLRATFTYGIALDFQAARYPQTTDVSLAAATTVSYRL